jgi:hypothetical protein
MSTDAQASGARRSIAEVMVAMVLIALPTAGVSVSASAAPNAPAHYSVLPAPPPADPPTNAPQPPPPAPAPPGGQEPGPYYCGGCDGGAGGGGGGGG